jgi:membrane-anchored protein YejM (alkaline phosphatase superfamily)
MAKAISILAIIYTVVFMLTRECQLVQHYIVINRDYVPVMSYFYGMAAQYFLNCVATAGTIYLLMRINATTKVVFA